MNLPTRFTSNTSRPAKGSGKLLEVHDWMQWFLGTREKNVLDSPELREELFVDGCFVHSETGRRWPAGTFEHISIEDLEARVAGLEPGREPNNAALTVFDGIDIAEMQSTLTTEDCAMVQIASNFNCLEVASRRHSPDCGRLVEGYAMDATQGPAASFGVPAASLLRAHCVFQDKSQPASTWGQTQSRQVELLENVRQYFGTCVNGKLTLSGDETILKDGDIVSVSNQIKVGLHCDAEVVLRRTAGSRLEVLEEPFQMVDQLLCASVNWFDPGQCHSKEQLITMTRATLRTCYEGAYLAAILRRRRLLLLTLVGGGVFRNPEDMILSAIADAHNRWAKHPASELQEVRLCLFQQGTAKPTQQKLNTLLAKLDGSSTSPSMWSCARRNQP